MNNVSPVFDPVQNVLDRLAGVKQVGDGQFMARCPAHDDAHASLSVGRGVDGRVLLDCKAGCPTAGVVSALGMKMTDLFVTSASAGGRSATAAVARPVPMSKATSVLPKSPAKSSRPPRRIIYPEAQDAFAAYCPAGGEYVESWVYPGDTYRVARFDIAGGGKSFRPVHRLGVGWAIGDPDGLLPLYNSNRIGNAGPAEPVIVVEGEKCAEAAASVRLAVVTSAHGSQSAKKSDWSPLAGREVVILPDNDAAGRKYAEDVAAILHGLTPPAVVKVVELPGLGAGGDIADWIGPEGPMGDADAETIKSAVLELAEAATVYVPKAAATSASASAATAPTEKSLDAEPIITTLADVKPQLVQWLWPSRIALGKLTLIAGDPGLGKSFITLDLAARVSRGTAWPDCPQAQRAPGGVVLLSAEDDLADTIRPRLDAAGADVSRIVAIATVKRFSPVLGKDVFEPFNLTDHLPALERAIVQVGDCRLVVIDPISAYLGGTDSHKNADVRGLLMPLSELAARHGVALIAVNHLRKGEGPAMYRSMGSLAFVAAARAAYAVTKDKEDPTGQRRFVLPIKNNLGNDRNGLAYSLDDFYSVNGQPVVKWESTPVEVNADDALSDTGRRRGDDEEDTSELEEAKTWLADALAGGPVAAKEIHTKAKGDGIAKRTLERAKKMLTVTTAKAAGIANGGWMWSLGGENLQERQQERQQAGHGNVGDVGDLGDVPEKPSKIAIFDAPKIEDRQERQAGQERQGCQLPVKFDTKLAPERPGPTDLLTPEQYKRYLGIYHTRSASMSPAEKHARAWRAALKESQ